MLIGLIVGLLWALNFFWTWQGSRQTRAFDNLRATATALSIAPVVVAMPATPTGEPLPADSGEAAVWDRGAEPEVVIVTATPTPSPIIETRYEVIYETVIEYATVEVTAVPLPTVTPIPLAPGSVVVCLRAEGVKELYIGDKGMVSGGCEVYSVGLGQTQIIVKVNR